jgi:hypothetical protein
MPMRVETHVAFQVFYEWPITDEQAGRFVGWFDEHGHIGKDAGSALLRKEGAGFVLHMPMNDGIPLDASLVKLGADIAEGLSADVFARAPVEVHLCDRQLGPLKVEGSIAVDFQMDNVNNVIVPLVCFGDLGDTERRPVGHFISAHLQPWRECQLATLRTLLCCERSILLQSQPLRQT